MWRGKIFWRQNLDYVLIHVREFITHSRAVEKSGILFQIEKAPETSGGDLTCYVFSLTDAVAHLSVTDPSGILTIEK